MIRALHEHDADALAALRREALGDAPLAFAASPEDDRLGTAQAARRQLRESGDAVIVGAFEPTLAAMAGIFRDPHLKSRHTMHVWGVYVRPAHRRQGLAQALLRELIDHARRVPGIDRLRLAVSSAYPEARRLYERAGFEAWGTEPDALRHDGRTADLCHMQLRLGQEHATREELEAGLEEIGRAPHDDGTLELIVRRPGIGEREVLECAELDLAGGLLGDNWFERGSRHAPDGAADPERQITLMSSRVAQRVARDRRRWPLAGDQLFVDLDLGEANLPPGSRLRVGPAELEITEPAHTGCKKFVTRFGLAALQFVNTPLGRKLRLRGVHARVVRPGRIRAGDRVRKSG